MFFKLISCFKYATAELLILFRVGVLKKPLTQNSSAEALLLARCMLNEQVFIKKKKKKKKRKEKVKHTLILDYKRTIYSFLKMIFSIE